MSPLETKLSLFNTFFLEADAQLRYVKVNTCWITILPPGGSIIFQ